MQETAHWLDGLIGKSDLQTRSESCGALRAVLHRLCDRMAPTEASHLAAQLPTPARGIYYEAWNPARAPQKIRDWESLKAAMAAEWPGAARHDTERAIRAVFAVRDEHVIRGALDHVRADRPPDTVAHWSRAA